MFYDSRIYQIESPGPLNIGNGEDYITKYALEKAGIKTSQKIKERSHTLDPITCPHCSSIDPTGKRFCGQCGFTLTKESEMQVTGSAETIRQLLEIRELDVNGLFQN